jgi:hypothetical protein
MLRDTLSRRGAEDLKILIVDYWWRRGYDPTGDVRHLTVHGEGVWVVRSDLVNGLPIKRRP